jgi:hypothetical protein
MHQFALAAGQAVADFAQRIGVGQLTEQHGHELCPAGEAFGIALGLVLLDQQSERRDGKMIQ